jgi:hypothetical protein
VLALCALQAAFEPFEALPKTRVEPFGPLKFRGAHELTLVVRL